MRDLRAKLASLLLLSALAFAGGCASPVPGSVSTGTGKSIIVTIKCNGPMNPDLYYYFLINRYVTTGNSTGNRLARGPIPVLYSGLQGATANGYGNGFATGSQNVANLPGDNGITDYVFYNNAGSPYGVLGLYHIPAGYPVDVTDPGQFVSVPVAITIPDINNVDVNAQTTLSFRLYISQLLTTQETHGLTSAQVTALANSIQYLQVNIVATDAVPTDQTSANTKQVDSMGNSTSTNQLVSFLVLDLSQNTTITSDGPFPTLTYPEPIGDILQPPGSQGLDNDIDIVRWSIQISP